jgi:ATP-binding cassette subfamily B protein
MRFLMFNIVPTLLEIALVAVLFWALFSWHYALVTALAVAVYIGFTVKVTEWRNRFIREANQADSATHTRALDSLLNYETVKYFNNESYEAQAYDQQLALWERAKLSNRMSLFALNAGQAFIIALTMTILLWMASRQVQLQQLTVGDITMLNAYLIQLFLPLNFLGFVYREIRRALTDLENMLGLLQRAPQVVDSPTAVDIPAHLISARAMSLELRAVHFAYQPERPILKGLDLLMAAGKKIAIVGSSGAGKSTISRLLYGFYQPQQGQILLNGVDIQHYRLDSLRRLIGVVPQDTVLFNSSIRDNIAYGRPDASTADIDAAIDQAQLRDFIGQLPDGDATVVGERGLKLSGGEKQRVAIARVLLKNAPIVILDEATSALDSANEQQILAALQRIAQDRTCVVIAHRLSTVVDADLIVVLDDGRVVEQGTHEELLTRQGHYAAMWQQQSR